MSVIAIIGAAELVSYPLVSRTQYLIDAERTTSFRDTTVTVPWLEEGERVIDLGGKSGSRPNLTP